MCTAQSREAMCVYCTVWRGTVCVLHSLEITVCLLHSLELHCVCTVQFREAAVTPTKSISTDTIEPLL